MKAKDVFNTYKRNAIVSFNKITGRDRPGSIPFKLLKDNENIYSHMPKTAPSRRTRENIKL